MFVDRLEQAAALLASLQRPWLGPFVGDQHAPLFPGKQGLGSVALLPLRREDRAVGCLAFGANDALRFTRHHATDFLAHLAVIAAFCIESAVNRARLVRSGMTDALTGWHNRRYFENRVLEELARARREQKPLACLMLDVDYFKRVNDGYGHLAGDRLLRELTRRIEAQVRASDVAARYGGEELVLLLPATRAADALALAERIRDVVRASPVQVADGQAVTVTLSIGVATRVPSTRRRTWRRWPRSWCMPPTRRCIVRRTRAATGSATPPEPRPDTSQRCGCLRTSTRKIGTPISAVIAPTGSCRGANAVRATVSAHTSRRPARQCRGRQHHAMVGARDEA